MLHVLIGSLRVIIYDLELEYFVDMNEWMENEMQIHNTRPQQQTTQARFKNGQNTSKANAKRDENKDDGTHKNTLEFFGEGVDREGGVSCL